MAKSILGVLFGIFMLTLSAANRCSDLGCSDEQKCCYSINQGAECCSDDRVCDFGFGCVVKTADGNATSQQRFRDCPPGWKKCWSIPLIVDACCPYPFGVCCSDLVHCCPHGYECDLDHQKCNKKNFTIIHLQKREVSGIGMDMKQCGETTRCPLLDDCCRDGYGGWKCCRKFTKTRMYGRNV